ncbi:hypothetical protein [Aurantiacibacter aquimixticola]|nr:hypothetical protein [Aurantiacibacter aquimixticola]
MTLFANPDRSAISMLSGTVLSFVSLVSLAAAMAPGMVETMM